MRAEENLEKNFNLSLSDWEKLPRGPEWSTKRKPGHFVVRTRVVRLSDGSTVRYIVQRKRVVSRRELAQLEREIEALKREARAARIMAIDRVLLARKNAENRVNPRRKKSRRRKG